ncbi:MULTISPECIES: hypothetical protein [Polyangium]|uniref:Uncharacterized protein n=2 Tax=Polyangium TaxID=55 RepID=A0A4V5PL51_9BACT|nr:MULTISPECIES: hypothetical protein [Polyangium]MDI1433114.1 hypothetical protein [Polyangium sorediatum]TKC98035.1 hypothetical protein E8A74_43000 [Polyangium fumosum]
MVETTVPIIVDLGKKKRSALKSLKRGRGRLVDEVEQTIDEIREGLGQEAANKEIVPIVIVYRKKQKRSKGLGGILG